MQKGSITIQDARPNPNTGHRSTHHSHHSTRPPSKRNRGRQRRTGGPPPQHPPFTHNATHPQRHPPPPRRGGGERTKDTPPHEQHRHTHPHTPHTRQGTIHDMTAVLTDTRRGGGVQAGPHTPGRADRQQHTPPPFNTTHRRGWTPSALSPLTRSHSHNQRTIMMIDKRSSSINHQSINDERT